MFIGLKVVYLQLFGLLNVKNYLIRCPNPYLSLVEEFLAYLSKHHKEEFIFKEH